MTTDEDSVATRVIDEMAKIANVRMAAALRKYLVAPRRCMLDWDYGHPHPEFSEPRYPGFVIAEFADSRTAIAYSEYGFGPNHPWGLIWLDRPGYGMDSGWFDSLEDAFRESMAWDES